MTKTEKLALGSEFPPATQADWRKLVDSMLKGMPFEKRLVNRTYDGLEIQPLYARRPDTQPIPGRAPGAAWQIMQRIDHPDSMAANAQALRDLENGATGLSVVFAGAVGGYGFGLPPRADAVAQLLAGIYLDAGIVIECDPGEDGTARLVADCVAAKGISPRDTHIRFGHAPLAMSAVRGGSASAWTETARQFAADIASFAKLGFEGPFAAADGRVIHNAGGSEVQELAFALASALAYLRALEQHGIALDDARRMIFFRLSADADQFLTMAKFRALRKLWTRVEAACGLSPAPTFVAAETAWRMMTRRDVYVNMLRATIAAFAAGLGGADAITVLPFTAACGLPDRFARRTARNTQLILLEEANLAKVSDPAAGSGAIEALTEQLCAAAWTFFQSIEATGGAAAALESGLIQHKVAAVRAERSDAIARRKDALTGASDFPNLAEIPAKVLDMSPSPDAGFTAAISFPPLRSLRLAEPFERLRDRADAYLAKAGSRPKIFLANLGSPSDFSARAAFAKNFFEAGGIEALGNDGFGGDAEMVAAFRASGARLACLCSSDDVYAKRAVDAAEALRAAGTGHIFLAGRPRDPAPLLSSGIGGFVYAGCDLIATVQDAYRLLGDTGSDPAGNRPGKQGMSR